MSKHLRIAGALLLLLSFSSPAQINLLKDINSGKSIGSYPDNIIVFGNNVFYTSSDPVSGFELWRSDGTAEGTILVKDINPGSGNSLPGNFKAVGDILYFTADNGENGRELWRTNGNASGTYMVSDINPGAGSSDPTELANSNGKLYFNAFEPTHGAELWYSNGNSVGTIMVADINPGINSSSPTKITTYNNFAYFTADDGSSGAELWKINGPSADVSLISDIYPQAAESVIAFLQVVGSHLVFSAYDGTEGYKAWVSDGTTSGTVLLKNINLSFAGNQFPNDQYLLNGYLYFSASEGSAFEPELWRTDGTTLHTELVATINPVEGIGSDPLSFIVIDSTLYFVARPDDNYENFQLYKSNGDIGNYTLIDSHFTPGRYPKFPANLNGTLTFTGGEAEHGEEFNAYDGNTITLFDLNPGTEQSYPTNLVALSDVLLFAADNGTTRVLWKYDGTNVSQVGATTDGSSNPALFTGNNSITYFVASNGNGRELWKTNGTTAGTQMIKDINPMGDSSPTQLMLADSILFFAADDGVHGKELWKSDGTAAGTVMIADINLSGNSNPADMIIMNNTLFFSAVDGTNGEKLWKYEDGNVTLVKNTIVPQSLIVWGSYLYYVDMNYDSTGAYHCGLYRSDGTTEGTELINNNLDGCMGPSNSSTMLAIFDSSLYFAAQQPPMGTELWKYDGITSSLVKDINVAGTNYGSYPGNFTVMDNSLFFSADDGIHGYELWITDGSAVNTQLVKDVKAGNESGLTILPGHGPPFPPKANLISYAGKLFFSGSTGQYTFGLWSSDGTEAGTTLMDDNGPSLNYLPNFIVKDSLLYFVGDEGSGNAVYVTEGTICSTRKVTSNAPVAVIDPQYLTSAGSLLYVSELGQSIGREPFIIDPSLIMTRGCPPPEALAQATALAFSDVTDNSMTVSFTANSTIADGYITLMQAFGSPYPDDKPVNGTTYHVGNVIGSSTIIVHNDLEPSFPVIYLLANTEYFFAIFAYQNTANGPTYLTTSPLQGSQFTLPAAFAARQKSNAYPNPFNELVTIPFATQDGSVVVITIFDYMGNKVVDLTNETYEAGHHEITWNGTDHNGNRVNKGLYTYSVRTDKTKSARQGKLMRQ